MSERQPRQEGRQPDPRAAQVRDEAEPVETVNDDEIVTDLDVDDDAEHIAGGSLDGKGNDVLA